MNGLINCVILFFYFFFLKEEILFLNFIHNYTEKKYSK